jgi:hypothetical protein
MAEVEATFRGQHIFMRMKGKQTMLGAYCTQCMLDMGYDQLGVCCTQGMMYLVYVVFDVYGTQCMMYLMYTVCGICCARCTLYSVYAVPSVDSLSWHAWIERDDLTLYSVIMVEVRITK